MMREEGRDYPDKPQGPSRYPVVLTLEELGLSLDALASLDPTNLRHNLHETGYNLHEPVGHTFRFPLIEPS